MKIDQFLESQSGADIYHALTDQERKLLIGQTLKGYKIRCMLAVGGMATVFKAERVDGVFDKTVAIKVEDQRFAQPSQKSRFLAERQILATLSHPNIAQILDGGITEHGLPYFIMNFIEGDHIDRYALDHQLDVKEKLRLFLDVAKAVAYAHQQGIIHRDIKPSNILVDDAGRVRLMDFGIAKQDVGSSEKTLTAQTAFTPTFASPEQLLEKTVGYPSDIYQLGLLLHTLLSNRCINREKSHEAILTEITTGTDFTLPSLVLKNDPSVAHSEVKRIRGDLDAITAKCLRYDPSARYDSVLELITDIEHHLAGKPVSARSGIWEYRVNRLLFRYKKPLLATALMLIVFAVSISTYSIRLAQEKAFSQTQYQKALRMTELVRKLFSANTNALSTKTVPTTIDEILENAESEVFQLKEVDLETQIDLLDLLARIQYRLGNIVKANALIAHPAYQSTINPNQMANFNAKHFSLALSILLNNRKLSDAEKLSESAIRAIPLSNETAPTLISAYLAQAFVLKEAGDANKAIAKGLKAQEINEQFLNDDEKKLDIYFNIATSYLALGKFKESLIYLERAETLMQKDPNTEPERFVTVYHSMAQAYDATGKYQQAIDIGLKNIETVTQSGKSTPEQLAIIHIGLGISYKNIGDYKQSIEMLGLARQHAIEGYGPEHLLLAIIDHNLSNSYIGLGNYQQVYFHLQRAKNTADSFTDKDHSIKARINNNLGGYYRDIKNYQKALDYSQLAYQSKLSRFGEDSVNVARTRLNVIRNQCQLGRFDGVSEALAQTRSVYGETYGHESPRMAFQQIVESECFAAKGEVEKALSHYEKALALRIRDQGPEHRLTSLLYTDMAALLLAMGDSKRALETITLAIQGYEKNSPSHHPERLDAELLLTEVLIKQTKLDEAKKRFEAVSSTLSANDFMPEFIITRYRELAEAYQKASGSEVK